MPMRSPSPGKYAYAQRTTSRREYAYAHSRLWVGYTRPQSAAGEKNSLSERGRLDPTASAARSAKRESEENLRISWPKWSILSTMRM